MRCLVSCVCWGANGRYQITTCIDSKAGEVVAGAQSVIRGEMEQRVEHLHFAGQVFVASHLRWPDS